MTKLLRFAASELICLLAGGLGTIFTISAIPTWYATLIKPPFSPPNWLFGPVWTVLYLLMGIALYMIWQKGTKRPKQREALMLFGVQLFLNAIWSPIFFGARNLFLALIVIALMWIFILKKYAGIRFVHFSEIDVIRHPLVQDIIKAYSHLDREKTTHHNK